MHMSSSHITGDQGSLTEAATAPGLPNELADIVIEHCRFDKATLRVCSLVNRYWAVSSRRYLFSFILLRPESSQILKISSLLSSPHNTIAGSIQTLQLDNQAVAHAHFNFYPVIHDLARAGATASVTTLFFRRIGNPEMIRGLAELFPRVRRFGWGKLRVSMMALVPHLQEFKQLDVLGKINLVPWIKVWPGSWADDRSGVADPNTLLITKLAVDETQRPTIFSLVELRTPNLSTLHVATPASRTFQWDEYQSFLQRNASNLSEVRMTFHDSGRVGNVAFIVS